MLMRLTILESSPKKKKKKKKILETYLSSVKTKQKNIFTLIKKNQWLYYQFYYKTLTNKKLT
jgi:hypothetical protein